MTSNEDIAEDGSTGTFLFTAVPAGVITRAVLVKSDESKLCGKRVAVEKNGVIDLTPSI